MGNRKRLLLKAEKHNWGMIGPGQWVGTTWRIFYDGTFEISKTFRPSSMRFGTLDETPKRHERPGITGRMTDEAFSKLRKTIKRRFWINPFVHIEDYDGDGWEIESYREDGSVANSSGNTGYIYGHRVLETIVSLLPMNEGEYNSSAYISDGNGSFISRVGLLLQKIIRK